MFDKKAYMRKWKQTHKKQHCELNKRYAERHPDKIKKRAQEYYKKHQEVIKQRVKNNRNPARVKEYDAMYRKSVHGKKVRSKHNYDRRRNLRSEYLNNIFEGCHRHHINKDQIVCIPAELHMKYRHNHKKPETMIEINKIAMQYLFNCKA